MKLILFPQKKSWEKKSKKVKDQKDYLEGVLMDILTLWQ